MHDFDTVYFGVHTAVVQKTRSWSCGSMIPGNKILTILFHLLQLDYKNCAAIEGIHEVPDNYFSC